MKCCEMSAAQLRNQIEIQRLTLVPDAAGGQESVWATILEPKAKMVPKAGGEYRFGMKVESRITEEITIRYIPDLQVTDRIVYNSRVFNIRRIFNLEERNRWLLMQCEEGVAQ